MASKRKDGRKHYGGICKPVADCGKISIFGIEFEIVRHGEEDKRIAGGSDAYIYYAKAMIVVGEKVCDKFLPYIICHEFVHGVLFLVGYCELRRDERFVSSFGNMMSMVFERCDDGVSPCVESEVSGLMVGGMPWRVSFESCDEGRCMALVDHATNDAILCSGLVPKETSLDLVRVVVEIMFYRIGRHELCSEKTLVYGMANAIAQSFRFRDGVVVFK